MKDDEDYTKEDFEEEEIEDEDDCNCSDPECPCGGIKRGGYISR